jgi:hypothetical protein
MSNVVPLRVAMWRRLPCAWWEYQDAVDSWCTTESMRCLRSTPETEHNAVILWTKMIERREAWLDLARRLFGDDWDEDDDVEREVSSS